MSEPHRLADETSVSLERDLLRAGIEDAPAPGAHGRAEAALGIAAPVIAGTSTPTSVTPGAPTGVAGSMSVAKLVGIAALALAVAALVAIRLVPSRPEAPAGVVPPAIATATATVTETPSPSIAPSIVPAPSEVATVAPSAKVTTGRPMASLGDEISVLDRARAALRDGDPSTALRLLDEHDARFRGDTFALESSVLRIDALDALGRSAAALALADRFLAAHPNTPMSQHVRSVADRLRADQAHP